MQASKLDTFASSIESIASKPTERKTPNGQQAAPQQETVQQASSQGESQYFEPEGSKPLSGNATTNPNPGNLAPNVIKQSGETGAYIAAGSIEMVFSLLERLMFIRKFSASDKEQLLVISEKPESQLTEDEKSLNYKFLTLTKKHDKIRDKIPFEKKDIEAMEMGFAEHARITGNPINPQLILWGTIIKAVTGRAMEIFL